MQRLEQTAQLQGVAAARAAAWATPRVGYGESALRLLQAEDLVPGTGFLSPERHASPPRSPRSTYSGGGPAREAWAEEAATARRGVRGAGTRALRGLVGGGHDYDGVRHASPLRHASRPAAHGLAVR
jgi:hypothetical protein